MRIKYYLRLLATFARLSLMSVFEYRTSGIMTVLHSILGLIFGLIFFQILFQKTALIAGWNREQIFLFYGVFLLTESVADMFFSGNLSRLGEYIENGRFDSFLVRPGHPLFLLSFRRIRVLNIFNSFFSVFVIGFSLNLLKISPSPALLAMFFPVFLAGLTVYYSLWTIIATFSFWTTRTPYLELLETVSGITRYPMDIFGKNWQIFFTVFLPLIFVVTVPSKTLLGVFDGLTILALPTAAIIFFVTVKFWNFAIKFYSSVGS